MASDDRKAKKREAMRAIERVAVVLRRWDPIGAQPGVAGPADEYDGYAPLLVALVQRGATVEELGAKLGELSEQMMGVRAAVEYDTAIAREIIESLRAPDLQHASSKKRSIGGAQDEGSYTCPSCGESIVVPLDPSEGDEQSYLEDCPVCCNPNMIHVEFFGEDEPARVWAEAE